MLEVRFFFASASAYIDKTRRVEGRLSTKEQQYDPTSIINEVRGYVDTWRSLPSS